MNLEKKKAVKEPLILKGLISFFIVLYAVLSPILLFSSLIGWPLIFGSRGISGLAFAFGLPISMIAAIFHMRSMRKSGEYREACWGMAPGIVCLIQICPMLLNLK